MQIKKNKDQVSPQDGIQVFLWGEIEPTEKKMNNVSLPNMEPGFSNPNHQLDIPDFERFR